MDVEPPPVVRQRRPPALPLLTLGKRKHSRGAEESDAKRRFFGGYRYEDIVYAAVERFFPLMWLCQQSTQKLVLDYGFLGRNERGQLDPAMRINFYAYQVFVGPLHKRAFRVRFRVFDSAGLVLITQLMQQQLVRAEMEIMCGLSKAELYNELVSGFVEWLDFANRNFALASVPRNLHSD
jgi:hypothetical protein